MTRIGRKIGLMLAAVAVPALLAVPMASAEAGGFHHRGYHYHRPPAYRYHDHHHGGNALAAGVLGGIVGLVVGSAITSNQNSGPDRVVVRERVVEAPPTWRNPDVYDRDYGYGNYGSDSGWYQPVPVAQQQTVSVQDSASCLQTREYQTHITVGGKDVEAYGTACLQPDGAWKFGAPTPEPQ
jgi:surface antigen